MKPKTPDKTRHSQAATKWRRLAVLAALAGGQTKAAAAAAGGISLRTLDRWQSEPGFKSSVHEAQRQVFEQALDELKGLSLASVEALAALLKSSEEGERRRAAVELLGFAMRAHDKLDLEARVEALEDDRDARNHSHRTRPS